MMVPVERRQTLAETAEEIENMLKEPIQGITRESRLDEIEAESFAAFQKLMGG